jgi:hypothetical protein
MSDGFSVTSSESWISRMGKSIIGVLIGIVLFFVSPIVLFWNEGRAVQTAKSLDEGAANSTSISPGTVDPANDGKLVHLSGEATTDETLSDPDFGISMKAISLKRIVEMYQWKENQKKETRKNLGGGEETTTTYTYETVWSDDTIRTDQFQEQGRAGHKNPGEKPFPDKTFKAKVATLGAFTMSDSLVSKIGGEEELPVKSDSAESLPGDARKDYTVKNGQLYKGKDPSTPVVGDTRVSFKVIKPAAVSIIAQQDGKTFKPFHTKAGDDLNMLRMGTLSKDEMFKMAQDDNKALTWILRVVGYLMMAFGIFLVFRPIATFADIIPALGGLAGAGIAVFAGIAALPVTLIVIAIGWIFYRPMIGIPMLAVGVIGIGGLVYLAIKARGEKKAAATVA